jgi:arylsulfatase A-like enzyme
LKWHFIDRFGREYGFFERARFTVGRMTQLPRQALTARVGSGLGPWGVLALSAWCGLAAGLLEVGARVLFRAIQPVDRLYLMTRQFVWLTPLANLVVFLGVGLGLAGVVVVWPRLGRWLGPRLLCGLLILPVFLVANLQIYPEAWMVLAIGIGIRAVPYLERLPITRRTLAWSFPGLLAVVGLLAVGVLVGDWVAQKREASRPVPTAGAPNVLLVVLDTVRADRFSLYGYRRSTTPALERLAKRGIRFDAARATAPWTLASHASMFSGRWPHELGVQWESPLPATDDPMLAEYLGAHGYATVGLVANTRYCSFDTGLSRGFTHYEDYEFTKHGFLRTSAIVERARKTAVLFVPWLFRSDPYSVRRGFVNWLDDRRERDRPFFGFLNFYDAHAPYALPDGAVARFTRRPERVDELQVLYDDWAALDKTKLAPYYLTLARDSYDNCLAYLDEQVGRLVEDLERRGLMENTWVIITGDHGEGLGEHGLFDHGFSLYSTEIRVPLLVIPPAGVGRGRVVRETVSLRDLPATIVDLVGLSSGAPFPGKSLAELWNAPERQPGAEGSRDVFSELPSPNRSDPNHGRSPVQRGPLVSVAEGGLVYIKNEGDGTEELFDELDDPGELTNLALTPGSRAAVQRFQARLARLRAGSSGTNGRK